MFCYKCGYKANDGDRFCKECGTILRQQTTERKTIKLTCEDCNGILEVDIDRQILSCPYCGSKKLIQENDEVTIARINKAADESRMRHEKEMREYEEELRLKKQKEINDKIEKDWHDIVTKVLPASIVIFILFCILMWLPIGPLS